MQDKLTTIGFIIAFVVIVIMIGNIVILVKPPTPEEMRAGIDKCETLNLGYYQGGFGDVFCKIK